MLRGLPLAYLTLTRCFYITPVGLKHLKEMPLKCLRLSSCSVSDEGMRQLEGLSLTELDIGGSRRVTDAGLSVLRGMTLLENLDIALCENLSDVGMENLRELSLTHLEMSGLDQVTDKGLACLENAPLTHLDIMRTGISDMGLENLSMMPLKHLFACGCNLEDFGLMYLLELPLTELDISENPEITDDGLKWLMACPLEYLNFEECPKVTKVISGYYRDGGVIFAGDLDPGMEVL